MLGIVVFIYQAENHELLHALARCTDSWMDQRYVDVSINFTFANESFARKQRNVPVNATPTLHVALAKKRS